MDNNCSRCRQSIRSTEINNMVLGCGAYIHIRCFKNLVLRRVEKIKRSVPKRFRVRGIIGIPFYWMLCKCPGCDEFLQGSDLVRLEQKLKEQTCRKNIREIQRTPSPTFSLLAELDELSDISERDFE